MEATPTPTAVVLPLLCQLLLLFQLQILRTPPSGSSSGGGGAMATIWPVTYIHD